MKNRFKRFITLSSLSFLAAFATQVQAAGYKLEFESASVLADAGEAAVVEDAGTNWYNSAGVVDLPQQIAFSMIDLYAPTTFTGTTTAPSPFGPAFSYAANGSASSHPNAVLPAIHYALPLKENFAFGITIAPAWGFLENYGDSIARYDLIRVYTKSIDIAPSISWRINRQWSVGAGPDFNYLSVISSNNARTEGPPIFGGTAGDSLSRFSANTWNTGAHAGILFKIDEATRVGLNYRTKIVMDMTGYSDFALNGGPTFETNKFKLAIPLPPTTTFSIYHDINAVWALMGTIAYDQWSVLRAYNAQHYIQPPTLGNPSGLINVSQLQNMNNTFDLSIGTHYRVNEQLMLRGSLKYEPTPTNNQNRDINFPDQDKLGINLGLRYQINPHIAVDGIYGHVFVKSAPINATNIVTASNSNGHSNTSIDLFGAQLVWTI